MTGTVTIRRAIALRYATALFHLAGKRDDEDRVLQDLQNLKQALNHSSELFWLFNSPAVSSQQSVAFLKDLQPFLGLDQTVYGLLLVLAQRGRLNIFSELVSSYEDLLQKKRRKIIITVTSALSMTVEMLQKIGEIFSQKLSLSIHVIQKIDSSLKAGFIVQAGSLMIDASLRTKLDHLQRAMKEGKF